MSIDGKVDNYDLPTTKPLWVESIDISNIPIWEKSPYNFWFLNDFSEITLLDKNENTATISINGRIFTVFWDSNLNEPRYFSIENNGKKTIFIYWPSDIDWCLELIWKNAETYRVENIENPLVVVNNSVYIIYSEVDLKNEDEKWYLAINLNNPRTSTKLYWIRNECILEGMSPKMNFIEIPKESRLLWDWYYVMGDHLFDIVWKKEVEELSFCWNPIKGIYHIKWNSFYGRYKNSDIKFCFYPLESIQIPNIDLFWRTFFTDKEWFILEWAMKWYKIEDPEWYKIDDDFIFIWLTDKDWKTQYIKLDVLEKGLSNKNFDINRNSYTFKQIESKQFNLGLDEDDKRFNSIPFAYINDCPILEERVYCNWEYNTWFSWENWVDYAFVLTKNWDKKLLAIRWQDTIEINPEDRFEEKSSHSENLKNWVRVVWLHSSIWLVILTNNDSTTSNYRYYALKEDWALIYIWWKDNIWCDISKWELFFHHKIKGKNITSQILFWKNWLPLVDFKANRTFIVCENNWKNLIYSLKVVDDYRELTPENIIIEIPEGEDIEQSFRDYIENKIQLIPWTDFLYIPWKSFGTEWRFQFIWIDWKVSEAERIEDLPKITVWWKSYYILLKNDSYHPEYFLYNENWKGIKKIESLEDLYIRTSSCSSTCYEYSDKVGLKETICGSYIYPKANDLLPENIRLALVDENWDTKNQYVVYDEETNAIIWRIPTSNPPIKTSNPNEFILVSDENDGKYSIYNIETWEIKEKIIPKWLTLNSENLTESYNIGWTRYKISMNNWKPKRVKAGWKNYYEVDLRWEFFDKEIIHLYDSKKEVILPFFNNNWVLSPVFDDIILNMSLIVINDGVLKYRFSYQSSETEIPLNKIVSTWWWKYLQFVNSNRGNEEKDKIVSFWNNSLRIWESLNSYFSDVENNYKAYLVEENEDWLKSRELPQIVVRFCSEEYTSLLINWIEINLNFDYMGGFNTDNTQNLWILEKYLKKILWSMVKKYPITVVSETKEQVKKIV